MIGGASLGSLKRANKVVGLASKEPSVERINMMPGVRLMVNIGKVGNSVVEALADLVDNSIDARLPDKVVEIDIKTGHDEDGSPNLVVLDNASGMTKEELIKGISLARAKKDPNQALGRYGVGMKVAALTLGSSFAVHTAPAKSTESYSVFFEEKEWEKRDETDWTTDLTTRAKKDPKTHGTQIVITDLKVNVSDKLDRIRKDLGRRFSAFIGGDNPVAVIRVNDEVVEPEKRDVLPAFGKNGRLPVDVKIEVRLNNETGEYERYDEKKKGADWAGKTIPLRAHGWVSVLAEGSAKGEYGFTTFKNGRAITTYDKAWIPGGPHTSVQRVYGELNLEGPIDPQMNKKDWETSSWAYQLLREAVLEEPALLAAKKFSTDYRATDRKSNDAVMKRLNTLESALTKGAPVMKTVQAPAPRKDGGVAKVSAETRKAAAKLAEPNAAPEAPSAPVLIQYNVIDVGGHELKYRSEFEALNEDEGAFLVETEKDGLLVRVNTNHVAFRKCKDPEWYALERVLDALTSHQAIIAGWDVAAFLEAKFDALEKAARKRAK